MPGSVSGPVFSLSPSSVFFRLAPSFVVSGWLLPLLPVLKTADPVPASGETHPRMNACMQSHGASVAEGVFATVQYMSSGTLRYLL